MTSKTTHQLGPQTIHTVWDRGIPPVLTINSGDTVVFRTLDASFGNAARRVQAGEQQGLKPEFAQLIADSAYPERPHSGMRGHPLTGPVFVRGAEAGDALIVEVVDIRSAPWGWTSCRPKGIGLLDAELAEQGGLTEQVWHYWDLRGGTHAPFGEKIRVPLAPFCGVMGLALAAEGPHVTSPPRQVGGNMDVRQLVKGSVLELPVEVEGALFSVGDVHAAQGDGEVCGTGIEMEADVTLRFSVRQQAEIQTPQLRTPRALDQHLDSAGWFATTGHAPDLMEAARIALRSMLRWLSKEHGLSIPDAYILSSACVDLKISQVVDAPNWTVSAFVPLRIFEE
ncbi:acetamidase/formamidase family protein [Deinococcus peraridilitoris]|uniref:Putative acetamidase/formamidase n=1 Tax=Deinococcus peraridilitoris (strain DSM 19664 / LMG 22246 / CIP 109416 / KR-200) TaxID=937777 RepID=L0A573_DEIPD|nr:acetamidase/formamidase family protein [Deinococcus peraridilitoris]AFZ69016.1 putative acetamidase/formamidase [Deinococcus peraridilitoris DSM 19664]